jgi:hypothetical protein
MGRGFVNEQQKRLHALIEQQDMHFGYAHLDGLSHDLLEEAGRHGLYLGEEYAATLSADELRDEILHAGLSFEEPDLPLVSLEAFFEGNGDDASFAANHEELSLQMLHGVLKSMRDHAGVQDVLVGIRSLNPVGVPWSDGHAYSDTAFALANGSRATVEEWVEQLSPDEVSVGWGADSAPPAAPPLQSGIQVYRLWWD